MCNAVNIRIKAKWKAKENLKNKSKKRNSDLLVLISPEGLKSNR